ncbi:probable glutamate receptor [Galendromus occidentalis]|uniref:Probable glutamate receptor n=1 Tax=Galendromus occidentalis TaxID=34638 RepID=A0AAJ7L7Q6_9ACAR|nr:probable glutamate receptor [Galendromus occidentalis]
MRFDGKGRCLRIASLHFAPWYVRLPDGQGRQRLGGVFGSMMTSIMASLNLTYVVFPPRDGQYGMALPNGSFNGMLGMVRDGSADIAAGPFSSSEEIFQHFYVPPSIMSTVMVMLSGMETAFVNKAQSFTNSFASEVWLGLLVSFAAMSGLMAFREYLVQDRKLKWKRVFRFCFELFQALLQEASKSKFRGPFARLLAAVWFLFSLIFGHSFASQCRANLIVRSPTERIDTVEDLVARPHLTIYYAKNSPLESRMKNLVGERGDRLRQHIAANSEGSSLTSLLTDELLERIVAKKGVIFMEKLTILPAINRWCLKADNFFHISSENLAELTAIWALSKSLGRDLESALDMKFVLLTY